LVPSLLATTSADNVIRFYDVNSNNGGRSSLFSLGVGGEDSGVNNLANISFNHEGSLIAAACKDKTRKFFILLFVRIN
jgi:WD40 repeat protein